MYYACFAMPALLHHVTPERFRLGSGVIVRPFYGKSILSGLFRSRKSNEASQLSCLTICLTFASKRFRVFTKALILLTRIELERVKGIEPSSQAWEARILPLNHTRPLSDSLSIIKPLWLAQSRNRPSPCPAYFDPFSGGFSPPKWVFTCDEFRRSMERQSLL